MSATKKRDPLLSLFPVPRLLAMDAAGLEISEHSLKYLRLSFGASARIHSFGNRDLAAGVIAHGEIEDVDALADALRGFLKEVGNPRVHVSLPEQKGYIFRMTIPQSSDLSVKEAVEFKLEEHIPLSPSDVIFDWEVLAAETTPTELALNVTAFPRTTLEEYYEALSAAGFLPLSFEIESQAAARAVLPQGNAGAAMIVDFGETRTAISVAQDGVVRFTTSLELAGEAVTKGLISKLSISAVDAERIKNEEGIASSGGKASAIIEPTISLLRNELQRHFLYWHTHGETAGLAHAPIDTVILCGGNANIRGLSTFLGQTMRARVVLADVWQNAFDLKAYIPPIPHNQSLRYATVTGLALRGGIINA